MVRVTFALCLVVIAGCSPAREASNFASGTPASNVSANATLAVATTIPVSAPPIVAAASTAAPRRQLSVTAIGYGAGSFGVGYAFTVKNENALEAAESITAQIAWQDANGTVLGTQNETISVLGPEEHTGVGGTAFSSAIKPGAKMTVQVLPTKWTASKPIPAFTFTNSAYIPESFSSKVTGIIHSPYSKDLKLVRVSAIGVDANGQIVGGGYTYLDFVPAGGTAAVSVTYSGAKPINVAVYAQLTSLSILLGQ